MNTETIKAYKKYYYDQMIKHQWNYCTAFQLTTVKLNASDKRVKKALRIKQAKDLVHKKILSYIKKKIMVQSNKHIKRGIPFYAYYIICKEEADMNYHLHMILNIPKEYEVQVNNYFEFYFSGKLLNLETEKDVKKMINYMLKKGNLVINSDDERLLPTPYNLKVNKKHFSISN